MININDLLENKKNVIVLFGFFLLIGIFIGIHSSYTILNNMYFKFIIFIFVLYSAYVSIYMALFLSIVVTLIYQLLIHKSINEHFSEMNLLKNPLKTSNDLKPYNENIFKLISPHDLGNNLIEEGRDLLNIAQEMRNQDYVDDRELRIIHNISSKGNILINNGMNILDQDKKY